MKGHSHAGINKDVVQRGAGEQHGDPPPVDGVPVLAHRAVHDVDIPT